jgi:hypothetical protein
MSVKDDNMLDPVKKYTELSQKYTVARKATNLKPYYGKY